MYPIETIDRQQYGIVMDSNSHVFEIRFVQSVVMAVSTDLRLHFEEDMLK